MKRVLFVVTVFVLLLTACAPAQPAATEEFVETEQPSYPNEPSYPAEQDVTDIPADLTPAELAALKQLAANLGLQEGEISVVSSEETEFGDACLGVSMEGLMCAQVITPGRIIVLEANDVQYEYHVSENGSRVQPATLALVWKREGGIAGFCDTLTVFRSGEVYTSNCKSQSEGRMSTFADLLTAREREQFSDWIKDFGEAQLDASDPEGIADRMVVTVELFGTGGQSLSDAEQQVLLNFSQNLY